MTIRQCLPPNRTPRPPQTSLPRGAIDTHVHVFDGRYPMAPTRGYDPPESTLHDLRHLHATLGIDRVVLTQPSVYATDNAAILEAAEVLNSETPGRAKAVIAVSIDVTDDELAALHERGARGVRLNTDNAGGMPIAPGDVAVLAERIAPLGWHIEFLFPGRDIEGLAPVLSDLGVPVSIGHFAYQRAVDGVAAPGFRTLLDLVRAGNTWVKISGANRVSATDLPPYDDVEPMVWALLDAGPGRIMWGTDWPHPNKYEVNPNDGDLVDALGRWIPDPGLMRAVAVDTPAAFYGF
jgi:2-pyrone-4,6-dicarboxylate lactonase